MALQYEDGTFSDFMPFEKAFTEFLQNEKAVSLHKLNSYEELTAKIAESNIVKRVTDIENKLAGLKNETVNSDIIFIPKKNDLVVMDMLLNMRF